MKNASATSPSSKWRFARWVRIVHGMPDPPFQYCNDIIAGAGKSV